MDQLKSDFAKMGIVLSQWKMLWGLKHGWLRWAPYWVRQSIVAGWNYVACFVIGHDRILEGIVEAYEPDGTYHCTACCKSLKPTDA